MNDTDNMLKSNENNINTSSTFSDATNSNNTNLNHQGSKTTATDDTNASCSISISNNTSTSFPNSSNSDSSANSFSSSQSHSFTLPANNPFSLNDSFVNPFVSSSSQADNPICALSLTNQQNSVSSNIANPFATTDSKTSSPDTFTTANSSSNIRSNTSFISDNNPFVFSTSPFHFLANTPNNINKHNGRNDSSLFRRYKYTDPHSYEQFIISLKLDLKDAQLKSTMEANEYSPLQTLLKTNNITDINTPDNDGKTSIHP